MSDLTSLLTQMISTQAGKEITANGLFDAVSPSSIFGRNMVSSSGLTWAYFGGRIYVNGTNTLKANGTVTLITNTTNYIEVDRSLTVYTNTTGFTPGRAPLYVVTTNASSKVSNYLDYRSAQVFARYFNDFGTVSKTITTTDVTLTAEESLAGRIICTGTLTASRNLILPAIVMDWTISNTCTAYNLTIKTASGTGVVLTPGTTTKVHGDGTNILAYSTNASTPIATTGLRQLGKVIISNNATTSYTVPANTSFVAFLGTNTATLVTTLPAASETIDGLLFTLVSQAAVTTATWTSTGAIFIGAPASLTANTPVRFTYHHATTNWIIS